jgi:hypothetical protein
VDGGSWWDYPVVQRTRPAHHPGVPLLLGLLGVAGLLVLVTSDLLLVWTPQRDLDVFRAAHDKSDARIHAGALLGVFSIPFVLAGVVFLWGGLAPAGFWLAAPPLLLAGFAYVVGAAFHAVIGPFLLAIRDARASSADGSAVLQPMKRIFDVLRTVLWVSIFASSLWLLAALLSGRTLYPGWVAAVSPFPLVVLFRIGARVAPPAIAGALTPAGGNVAMLVFLLLSLIVAR